MLQVSWVGNQGDEKCALFCDLEVGFMEIILMVVLLAITLAFGWAATKLGMAKVVGQLIAGVVVGPALLHWVEPSHLMHIVSEFGVLLLMFNAGLETDARQLRDNFKAANFTALMGVIAPLAVFPVIALVFGYEWQIALFWGVVFAATSISITISVLGEQGKLGTQMGAVILGAAVLDDIMALLLVTAYSLFIGGSGLGLNTIMPIIAFAFGVLLRQSSRSDKILHASEIFGQWTVFPIFFGSIGLNVVFHDLSKTWIAMVVLTVFAVATKYYGAGIGARMAGLDKHTGNAIGAGMVSRGEMALVIAQIGATGGILSGKVFGEIVVVIIASTLIAPLMMRPLIKKVR